MAKCSIPLACKLCTHVFKSEGITPAFWETEKRQGRLRGLLLSTFKAMEAGFEFDLVRMIPNGCFMGYIRIYVYIYIDNIHLYPYTSMLDHVRWFLDGFVAWISWQVSKMNCLTVAGSSGARRWKNSSPSSICHSTDSGERLDLKRSSQTARVSLDFSILLLLAGKLKRLCVMEYPEVRSWW